MLYFNLILTKMIQIGMMSSMSILFLLVFCSLCKKKLIISLWVWYSDCGFALDTCFIVAMTPTKKRLILGFLSPISMEEMERRSELEFAVLNDKLEKEWFMTKHALPKRPVGRPRKDWTAPFLKPKVKRWSLSFQNQEATIKIGLLLPFGLIFSNHCNKLGILQMHWCTWGQLIDNQDPYIAPMFIL